VEATDMCLLTAIDVLMVALPPTESPT